MRNFAFIMMSTVAMLFTFTACGVNNETPKPVYESTQPETITVQNENQGEMTAVRFYYHSRDIDPNMYSLQEAFLYETIEIPDENFNEMFVKEFYERTGIPTDGIWFVDSEFYDNRLVINLHEEAISFFDTGGSSGSLIYRTILDKTLASLVWDGAFDVLVNWQRGLYGNHFSFNNVAYAENGEIVDRIWFNLGEPDNIFTLPNSSDGIIFVNGISLSARLFTADGATNPTHIPFLSEIIDIFRWETINTGAQSGILRDGESLATIFYVNYEYFMFNNLHRFDVNSLSVDDAFIMPKQ